MVPMCEHKRSHKRGKASEANIKGLMNRVGVTDGDVIEVKPQCGTLEKFFQPQRGTKADRVCDEIRVELRLCRTWHSL